MISDSRLRIADLCKATLLGVLLAALGFSWALATPAGGRGVSGGKEIRAAATSLRFSNPFLRPGEDAQFPQGGDVGNDPAGYDLGDACFGSQLVRYVNALGGFQPYTFTSSNIGAGLTLDLSGRVTGAVPAGGPAPASFIALVTDAAGSTRTGYFRLLTAAYPPSDFRFAMDRLPAAQVGVDYITNLQTIGGNPDATRFSVVSGSVQLNGAAIADLEYAGFTLSQDGTLAGRPLASGSVSFTARATAGAAVARDRSNTVQDQQLSLAIAAEASVQSQMATTDATIKGDRGNPQRGQFSLRALINPDGYGPSAFAGGRFVVRFGGATFQTTLDSWGRTRYGNLRAALDTMRGRLTVQVRNTDMAAIFAPRALQDEGTKTVVVEIEIGTTFRATEAIEFYVQSARGSDFKMRYRLGQQRQLGGLFQIATLKAADFYGGTAFRTSFVISHVKGRSDVTFGTPREAAVYIGPGFSETLQFYHGRGRFHPPGVRTLRVDTKRKTGTLETYALTEKETGIVPASQGAGAMQTFLLGLDLTTSTTFTSGDASRRIFPVFRR
ncbi:MAG: hypothetical protein NTW87_04265 [Planctomycetota bacterium]|nr:hypothetical protein [Planctomycetota bacterium]